MPVNFAPSWCDDDIELYRDNLVRFIDTELAPHDEEARKRGHVGREIWKMAGEIGLLCTDIPEEYGGGGGDFRHEAVWQEELGRRSLTGMSLQVHSIAAHYLLNHGTEEQKLRYLPRMARGELIGAIAMSEPGAGSDLQGVRTRAVLQGDHYVVNGSKIFISNGFLANLVMLVVKTDLAQGAKGTSILILETEDCQGYRVGRVLDKIGLKAQDTSELFFDEMRVPAERLLGGREGQGFFQMMSDLPYERMLIAMMAQGCMEGAYEATLNYVRERKAFGKIIADYQNTKFKLAEIATEIRVSRAFIDQCVTGLVAGTLDASTAAMAKLWTTERQGRVVDECLQFFGGYGYMNEYLIARMYADARVQRIYGGTSEIMKEVISRAL
jgi:acyl-CoA dehydrogenase